MEAKEIGDFLTHLAVNGHVSASTQNQALNALVFLYKRVLKKEPGVFEGVTRAKRPQRLPTVLSKMEVKKLIDGLHGTYKIMGALLYGTGMRVMELLRLRIKDLDFDQGTILIREGKGDKDRITMMPTSLAKLLQEHIIRVKFLHELDIKNGLGDVYLPSALSVKYPNMGRSFGWQYVFPAKGMSTVEAARRGIEKKLGIKRQPRLKLLEIKPTPQSPFGTSATSPENYSPSR